MASRILIVDDDPAIRATVSEVLADEGYSVATATNGAEGLAAVQKVVQAWDDDSAQHDRRFGFVSSSPDAGGATTEADLLEAHLGYWRQVIGQLAPGGRIELMVADPAIAKHVADRAVCDEIVSECKPDDSWNHPYVGAAFRLMDAAGATLGDGGLLPWTQLLTKNRKDRFLASGASLHALLGAQPS